MEPLQASGLALLATLERAGMTESFHHGVAVLVDGSGQTLAEFGDSQSMIYPRSALKPIQALAMRRLGLQLVPEQSVISMASHQGTQDHVVLVEQLLADFGFGENDLGCPPALPGNPAARANADIPRPIFMNCSGKHAGFLACCKLKGWDSASYLDLIHPLQQHIKSVIEELAGERISLSTVDGCGAPLFGLSSQALARAISRFMVEGADFVSAAIQKPWLIGDQLSLDAAFLRAGLFAKVGAEGVLVVGVQSGEALAIKIADGSLRAAPAVAVSLLQRFGLISDDHALQVLTDCRVDVWGGTRSIGGISVKI
jgi:L-asparaginase II